jgi:predicted DNA-binding antitoxin AbrB/MazE fold protein
MSQFIEAIYENGVLRPLTPLELPDRAHVAITVSEPTESSGTTLLDQQAALNAMLAVVDQLPQAKHADGLSGRDHDQILYGSRK